MNDIKYKLDNFAPNDELSEQALNRIIELESENEKLKGSIDECLAVIAHIDPELYSASDAVRMISRELLNDYFLEVKGYDTENRFLPSNEQIFMYNVMRKENDKLKEEIQDLALEFDEYRDKFKSK